MRSSAIVRWKIDTAMKHKRSTAFASKEPVHTVEMYRDDRKSLVSRSDSSIQKSAWRKSSKRRWKRETSREYGRIQHSSSSKSFKEKDNFCLDT